MKTIAVAALLFGLSSGIVEAAECGGVATVFNFCRRCVTVMEKTTARDTACVSTMRTTPPTGQARDMVIASSSLRKPAANGRVVVSNGGFTYTPKKGFVGRDSFTVEWDFLEQGQVLVAFGQINMEVKP